MATINLLYTIHFLDLFTALKASFIIYFVSANSLRNKLLMISRNKNEKT